MFGCVRYSELCVRYIARTTVVVPLDHFGDHCWVCPFTRVLNVCSRENVRLLDLCGRHHVYPYTLNLYTLNLNRNPSPPRQWLHRACMAAWAFLMVSGWTLLCANDRQPLLPAYANVKPPT